MAQWQRCKRLTRIGLTHRIARWRPSSLAGACLRHAIYNISRGTDAQEATDKAVMFFMSAGRDPGLDVPSGIDVYTLAMDYVAIIRNVVEALSRGTILRMHDIPSVMITKDISWKFMAHRDDAGVLHRWDFVDYIPQDPMEDLHSWEVFGDIAAMDSPMVLHYVAMGRRSGSHQSSPWCRTYAHPTVANIFRFNKNSGEGLKESWKPVYFSGNRKNTSEKWVNWMERDNAVAPLIKDINVSQVSAEDMKDFRQDVIAECQAMQEVTSRTNPRVLPKSRYGCDHPYICQHQAYCYDRKASLDSLGIYKRVNQTELTEA